MGWAQWLHRGDVALAADDAAWWQWAIKECGSVHAQDFLDELDGGQEFYPLVEVALLRNLSPGESAPVAGSRGYCD